MKKIFAPYGELKEFWLSNSIPCFGFAVYRNKKNAGVAVMACDGVEVLIPDREEVVRVVGTFRITCVVASADTVVSITAISRKLLLMETIEEKTVPEDIEGVLAAIVESVMRGTVIAKGATEK